MARAEQARPAIRQVREALGMSQAELAARAGIDAGHLSRVERGTRKASRIYLNHVARVLAQAAAEATDDDVPAAS